jgi:hypothetical protein
MDAQQQPPPNQSSQQMNSGMPQMQQNMMMQPNQMPMGGQRPGPNNGSGGNFQQNQSNQGGFVGM